MLDTYTPAHGTLHMLRARNQLFHLRIVGPLAKVIDIITTIPLKMKWFFLVFLVFLISFTHALIYMLRTRRYRPCEGDSCEDINYPTDFYGALMASYFIVVKGIGMFYPLFRTTWLLQTHGTRY